MSSRDDELNHSASRTIAAIVGTIPLTLAVGVALTLILPLPASVRLTIGWYSVFPFWVSAACFVFLARSGRRAWLSLLCASLLASLVAGLALLLGRGAALPWS